MEVSHLKALFFKFLNLKSELKNLAPIKWYMHFQFLLKMMMSAKLQKAKDISVCYHCTIFLIRCEPQAKMTPPHIYMNHKKSELNRVKSQVVPQLAHSFSVHNNLIPIVVLKLKLSSKVRHV